MTSLTTIPDMMPIFTNTGRLKIATGKHRDEGTGNEAATDQAKQHLETRQDVWHLERPNRCSSSEEKLTIFFEELYGKNTRFRGLGRLVKKNATFPMPKMWKAIPRSVGALRIVP
jgi:hypothetical protein